MFMKLAEILNDMLEIPARRGLFLLAAFVLLSTIVQPGPPLPARGPGIADMRVRPVLLDEDRPERRRVGSLIFLRGWALDSDDPRFGGVSAMHVESDRVTAISDAGTLLEFPLPVRAGMSHVRVMPLPRAAGGDKRSRDTESLLVHGRNAWIGFESVNAIKRFDRSDWRLQSAAQPAPMRRWRGNSGPEAIVRLADGRYLVFCECGDSAKRFSQVLLFAGDPSSADTRVIAMRYRRPSGYRVTDADLLPDGRLIILHRRARLLEGFSAVVSVSELPELHPGAVIVGREVAVLRPPLTVDNLEALSVAREGGRTIVRIASDDNFMPIQRTLLLEFALMERPMRR